MEHLSAFGDAFVEAGSALLTSGAIGSLALLFVGLFISVIGLGGLFFAGDAVLRRLAVPSSNTAPIALARAREMADPLPDWLKRLALPPPEKRTPVREKLIRAGYRSPAAVGTFYAARVILTLLPPAVVAFLLPTVLANVDFKLAVAATLLAAVMGFVLPSAWVDRRIEARQNAIRLGFPDALDMLLVCVEAGLGLDAAMQRMALEIGNAHPIIAEEFMIVGAELRAGKARGEVLRDLARRVGVDEVSAFVTIMAHAERFGSSIADALRVTAAEMRDKRLVRAEEKANALPIKLSIAVGFCTVPAMIILVMAPAIVTVVRGLGMISNRM
ncbi:MAG TPA: type II secretion system F family protein [Alphaproteobacteria bacterium]